MFDIGFGELLVCAIVALLVLGPERLPGAVRTVGRWVGRARHTVNNFTDQIDREIRAEELRKRIDEEIRKAGIDDVSRQVNDALRAPLKLPEGAVAGSEENRILPPAPEAPAAGPAAAADAPPAPAGETPATPPHNERAS